MKLLKLFFLTMFIALAGCDQGKVQLVNDDVTAETKSIISSAIELERSIDEGRILRSATERDKESIKGALQNLKNSVLRLDSNPNDKDALMLFARVFSALDSKEIQILEQDSSFLDSFIDQARRLYAMYTDIQIGNGTITAQELETSEATYTWTLFKDNFTDKGITADDVPTLANFSMAWSDKGSGWGTGTNTISPTNGDHVYVTQGSTGAWLMTTCDLTQVKNPAFSIAHLFMINKGTNAKFSRPQEIIRDAFLVYASTDYRGGNPGNPRNSDKWTNLNIADYGGMPSGVDFHRAVSPEISLKPYEGKMVTLGFYFDFNSSIHEYHFIRWQIDYFELYGSSAAGVNCYNPDQLYSDYVDPKEEENFIFAQDFTQELGEFEQVTMEGDPSLFEQKEYQGSKYIEVSGFPTKANGVQLFYSPEIDLLGNEKPAVSVAQTGKFYETEAQAFDLLQVVVAEAESGKSIEELNWEKIPFTTIPSWNDYTVVDSEWFQLPAKFKNKKIRIGFRYHSMFEKNWSPKWQLNGVWVKNLEN